MCVYLYQSIAFNSCKLYFNAVRSNKKNFKACLSDLSKMKKKPLSYLLSFPLDLAMHLTRAKS